MILEIICALNNKLVLMTNYTRALFRVFYLILFQPTQFKREISTKQADTNVFLRILPWSCGLAVLGNSLTGYMCEAMSVVFNWTVSWIAVAAGIMFGMLVGWAESTSNRRTETVLGRTVGTVGGIAGGLAGGVTVGVADFVTLDIFSGGAFGVAGGVIAGVFFSGLIGLSIQPIEALVNGVVLGLLGGIACGLIAVVLVGLSFGLGFGLLFSLVFWLVYFRIVTYPFDVALSTIVYFIGKRYPRKLVRAWRWCPVVWNEMIWLPLPFLSRILGLLVQENRAEGFKEISFVIAERGTQRREARKALVDVTIRDLYVDTVEELAEVGKLFVWMVDVPITLSAELGSSLPRFDRVIHHIEQYHSSASAYLKSKAINDAISELGIMQHSLSSVQGRYAHHLIKITDKWLDVLHRERDATRSRGVMLEMVNPFVYGNPITETTHNVFCGRQDIVRYIEASILGVHQPPTLLLHGSRRMGKTSIVNQLPRLLGPDFSTAIVDCQNPAIAESRIMMLRYLSRAIAIGLRRRRITVEPLTASRLGHDPFAVFDDWLDEVERIKPRDMRVLLCLDEYERLQETLDDGWGEAILDALRCTLQNRPDIVLMFIGAHSFQEVGPAWTDRFLNARNVRISFLSREEVLPLLTKPVPEFAVTYAAGALDVIMSETNCQPFLTQAVAFELVQFLHEQQRRDATPDDVHKAVTRTLISANPYFANIWNEAGAQGQIILKAIAKGEMPPHSPTVFSRLQEHDVLNGRGNFAVPMVQRWMSEN